MSDSINNVDTRDPSVRDGVADWLDGQAEVPEDFADNVMEAWLDEVSVTGCESPVMLPVRARRPRWTVALSAGVAAAAAVLLALSLGDAEPRAGERVANRVVDPVVAGCDVDRGTVASVPVPDAPSSSGTILDALRDDARNVLVDRCAPCHSGGAEGAEADALDVFDTDAEQWWSSLSARQLGVMQERLDDAPAATTLERETVDALVAAELRG